MAGLIAGCGMGTAGRVHAPSGEMPPSPLAGTVKLVLYEREGCKHCINFEQNVLPVVRKSFADKLEIERRGAEVDMETPTIIVEGKSPRTFVGEVEAWELEEAIRASQ